MTDPSPKSNKYHLLIDKRPIVVVDYDFKIRQLGGQFQEKMFYTVTSCWKKAIRG